jgi:hypothetical protein
MRTVVQTIIVALAVACCASACTQEQRAGCVIKGNISFQALSIAESELMLTKVRSTRFGAMQFLSSIAPAGNDPVAASSEAQAHVVMDAAAQVSGAMQDGPAAFQRVLAEMARSTR